MDQRPKPNSSTAPSTGQSNVPGATELKPGKTAPKFFTDTGVVQKLQNRAHRYAVVAGSAIGILILLLIVGGVIFLRIQADQRKKQTDSKTQSLNDADLEAASQGHAKVGASDKSLTISGKTFFKEAVEFDGNLEIKGDVTSSGKSTISELSVAGPSELNGATIQTKLDVTGPTTLQGNVSAQSLSVGGTLNVTGNSSFGGALSVRDLIIGSSFSVGGHYISNGDSPGVAIASAAGSAATASISGNDSAGTLNCNAAVDATPGTLCSVSFVTRYTKAPKVMVTPASAGAAELRWYATANTNGFSIVATTHPGPASRSYSFHYWIVQ